MWSDWICCVFDVDGAWLGWNVLERAIDLILLLRKSHVTVWTHLCGDWDRHDNIEENFKRIFWNERRRVKIQSNLCMIWPFLTVARSSINTVCPFCLPVSLCLSAHPFICWYMSVYHFSWGNISWFSPGWVGLWGFLWWAPSAKGKDHHGVSSGWSSVWHRSNTGLSSTQYEQIPIILGVWPFWLTPFFFQSITFWRAYG